MPDVNQPRHPVSPQRAALDTVLHITLFYDQFASRAGIAATSLRAITDQISNTRAPTKATLPWLKLAEFGDHRTPRGSLRNDVNVIQIHGIEADYDGEQITLDRARQILGNANVAAILYTSPSNTSGKPRWRVLCPTSEPLPPEARASLVARVNGLFVGALARESFTLSQAYYYGAVHGAADHQVLCVEGRHIDLCDDLDAGAIGRDVPSAQPTLPTPQPIATPARAPQLDMAGSPYGLAALSRECAAIRGASDGNKHHTLNKAAFSIGGLVAIGQLPQDAAFGALADALATIRHACKDYRAAEQTLRQSFHDGMAQPRRDPEPPRATQEPPRAEHAREVSRKDEPSPEAPKPRILPLVYFGDVRPNLDAADFVEGVLTDGAMSVVYGPSNCGKTFFVSDLGMHVATGITWRERQIEAGGVIYCALEGGHGISNRVAAWRQHHALEGVEVPFAVVPVSINLLDPKADRQALADTVAEAASFLGCTVKLIVIDTLSRAMAGGNENAPDDMGALVSSADFIRQTTEAHICFIHHSGKDDARGARGHSLLRAATDTEIEISRQDSNAPSVARVTKQREMEIEGEFVFTLETVALGTNRRGKPVTSCIVVPSDIPAPPRQARKVTIPAGAQIGLMALSDALGSVGKARQVSGHPANTASVSEDEWRRSYYAKCPDDTQDAKKRAFSRAVTHLQSREVVGLANGFAWIVADAGRAV